MTSWSFSFLLPASKSSEQEEARRALIILNQPFSLALLDRVWSSCQWRCCADGGANRLYDLLNSSIASDLRRGYLPDLIKGDLDSIRPEVKDYYASNNVPIVQDDDQDTTDFMKCVSTIEDKERSEKQGQYDVLVLGGLSGRLDQTVHTLSYLYKLRKSRKRVYVVTDDNVAWVLDEGEHSIQVNHAMVGPTCGLLPVGVDSTILTTTGLRWNLTETESSFDGLVSTSNHFVPDEKIVWIKTSRPIWWSAELRKF